MAIVLAALWHSKPLFAPKALHFLVIDCPAFCTGVVIPGPKWRSQDRNVASGSRGSRDRLVALGDLMLPGDAAGELLADPQHAARNLRPPASFGISQKPLERDVFTLEVFEPLDSSPRPGFSYAAAETATERPGPQCVPVAGRIEALPQVKGLSNSG